MLFQWSCFVLFVRIKDVFLTETYCFLMWILIAIEKACTVGHDLTATF